MKNLKLTLVFEGIDIDDFDVLDRLAEAAPNVHWSEIGGEVQADVYSEATPVWVAVEQTVAAVAQAVPAARAIRVLEDFVATSDIAKRCRVSRETVRLWAKEASFPRPRASVGKGIKIWDWAAVNAWLRHEHAGALGDDYRLPTALEIAQSNAWLRQHDLHSQSVEAEYRTRPYLPQGGRWQPLVASDTSAVSAKTPGDVARLSTTPVRGDALIAG